MLMRIYPSRTENRYTVRMKDTSLGLDKNITALLSYLVGWISGLIILLLEKDNAYVRFHAMQSIIVFGGLTLLSILLGTMLIFFVFLIPLLNVAGVVLWILLMVKAYRGMYFKLPIVGDLAENWSQQFSA